MSTVTFHYNDEVLFEVEMEGQDPLTQEQGNEIHKEFQSLIANVVRGYKKQWKSVFQKRLGVPVTMENMNHTSPVIIDAEFEEIEVIKDPLESPLAQDAEYTVPIRIETESEPRMPMGDGSYENPEDAEFIENAGKGMLKLDAEKAEEDKKDLAYVQKSLFGSLNVPKSALHTGETIFYTASIIRDAPSCECGGDKARTTHTDWCPKYSA